MWPFTRKSTARSQGTDERLGTRGKDVDLNAIQKLVLRDLEAPAKFMDLIEIEFVFPEALCYMQLAEVVPESGRYTLRIDMRLSSQERKTKKVVDAILLRASCYVIFDLMGRRLGLDMLRIPEGIGLPIPGKGMGHMHTVLELADKVCPMK